MHWYADSGKQAAKFQLLGARMWCEVWDSFLDYSYSRPLDREIASRSRLGRHGENQTSWRCNAPPLRYTELLVVS